MKRILATIAALSLLGGGAAMAADLPARSYTKAPMIDPGINWSGFYVGINAGYGYGNAPTALALNDVEAILIRSGFDNPLPPTLHPEGFVGGGQAGYNAQFGSVVVGFEADLDYSNMRKTDSATGAPFGGGTL